ncbi:hypothetical protein BDF20DRAFT_456131 [Mycotypha africana]|uniref:uncharacterized protein n=1 Tax=Mycotypha africana TaxID=64632 RepID=UPI00230176F3|nr:uncharacterized protein BDF20DRAFT_456131 [Mycotypha africana]KAI8982197.1 hypothetical protein BDF20DRAFT_456131 [Mycotypha africana]
MSATLTKKNHDQVNPDAVPIDAGIIRCICPSIEDDGFTIQCEHCYVWQHAYCVGITHATIPDHYLCDCCARKQQQKKGPKMSKRIPMSKKTLHRLDAVVEEGSHQLMSETKKKKKRPSKSRVVSRFVHSIFKEARERWTSSQRWKEYVKETAVSAVDGMHPPPSAGPLLFDHGPFVTMDAMTLYTKGVLLNTPVSSKGLFASKPIPARRYLLEVTGDIMLKSEFKFDPINDYVILGTPLSHIMFYPTLDLCIDTRQFGNKARYIRRSCHPNAELRNLFLPYAKDDKTIHLGLFARRAIDKGEEITVGWNWQRGHIAWKENMNWHYHLKEKSMHESGGNQVIDEEEERRRKSTIKALLTRFEKEFGMCACVNKRKCLIQYLKRQSATPKETASQRRKSSVPSVAAFKNGRRKSSVILLKPKPVHLSNSATHANIITVKKDIKDMSEDEFLDVEGDIDIGDEETAVTTSAPPLTEDNSGEEDHDDLSSLSSLSSLSVYDDSDEEASANHSEKRKKKSSKDGLKRKLGDKGFHPNKSFRRATDKAGPLMDQQETPSPKEKIPNLPRKKLWMLNYMNTAQVAHSIGSAALSPQNDLKKEEHKQLQDGPLYKDTDKDSLCMEQTEEMTAISKAEEEHIEIVDSTSMIDIITVPSLSLPVQETEQQAEVIIKSEIDSREHEVAMTTDTQTSVMITNNNNEMTPPAKNRSDSIPKSASYKEEANEPTDGMDIDDGELSDASTVQLDEDEIKDIYSKSDMVGERNTDAASS